jgi:uncharacterized protein YqfB (UPF0267 family)
MGKLFLFSLGVVVLVSACGPRDVPARGGNGGFNNKGGASQNDKKKSFVMSSMGERSDTCPDSKQDYKTLVIPAADIESMNSGRVNAGLEAGNMNCFRVGSQVGIKTSFESKEIIATVIVKKTEGIAVNRLTQKHAEAFDMELDDLIARGEQEIENAKNRPKGKFDPQGMVSITYFENPAQSEEEESAEEVTANSTPSFFFTEGERPSNCPSEAKDWENLVVPVGVALKDAFAKMKAAIERADKNCFRVGSKINLKYVDLNNAPLLREVQVTAIEFIRSTDLSLAHAQMMGVDFMELKNHYAKQLKQERISIVYFQ